MMSAARDSRIACHTAFSETPTNDAVGFTIVLYMLVAIVTVGLMSIAEIASSADYALAEAAKQVWGGFGFDLIVVAALLSTASAINATRYGTARLSVDIAIDGELPAELGSSSVTTSRSKRTRNNTRAPAHLRLSSSVVNRSVSRSCGMARSS